MAKHAKLNGSGIWEFAGSRNPGWTSNLKIVNATTTNSNDSIEITGADGTALGTDNPGWVAIQNTSGDVVPLEITSDITIDLTGAHWGAGGKGDLTDALLRVYLIYDNDANVRAGVTLKGGRKTGIADTITSTTGTSITDPEDVLVDTTLTGGTWNAVELGGFRANFDDTGGAAEDLWAVQSGQGDLIMGSVDGVYQEWNPSYSNLSASPSNTHRFAMYGNSVHVMVTGTSNGTSNSTNFKGVTMPIKIQNRILFGNGHAIDNGAVLDKVPGLDYNPSNGLTMRVWIDTTFGTNLWTASGLWRFNADFWYEAGG